MGNCYLVGKDFIVNLATTPLNIEDSTVGYYTLYAYAPSGKIEVASGTEEKLRQDLKEIFEHLKKGEIFINF